MNWGPRKLAPTIVLLVAGAVGATLVPVLWNSHRDVSIALAIILGTSAAVGALLVAYVRHQSTQRNRMATDLRNANRRLADLKNQLSQLTEANQTSPSKTSAGSTVPSRTKPNLGGNRAYARAVSSPSREITHGRSATPTPSGNTRGWTATAEIVSGSWAEGRLATIVVDASRFEGFGHAELIPGASEGQIRHSRPRFVVISRAALAAGPWSGTEGATGTAHAMELCSSMRIARTLGAHVLLLDADIAPDVHTQMIKAAANATIPYPGFDYGVDGAPPSPMLKAIMDMALDEYVPNSNRETIES